MMFSQAKTSVVIIIHIIIVISIISTIILVIIDLMVTFGTDQLPYN